MTTLILVKNRDWYIPANTKSYKILVKLGFPVTRLHKDSKAILLLQMKKHKVSVRVVPFSEVLKKFQDSLALTWKTNELRDAKMRARSIEIYVTKRKETVEAKKDLEEVKLKVDRFLRRWGLAGEAIYSEARGLSKLYADITFSTHRPPVLQVAKDPQQVKKNIVELGNFRLMSLVDGKMFHWWLEVKTGPKWALVKYSKCLLTEITDPTGLISDLIVGYNK